MTQNISQVLVDQPACDWLTITTYDYRSFVTIEEEVKKLITSKQSQAHKMQYAGWRATLPGGGIAMMHGEQRNQMHHIIEASGGGGHALLELIKQMVATNRINPEQLRCTRLDVQITRYFPDWTVDDQLELKARARSRGLSTGEASSHDRVHGELMTIYIGSRSSGRFCRVYQKVLEEEDKIERVWLRCEVVFRRAGGSETLFWSLVNNQPVTIGQSYAGALQAINDVQLKEMYMPAEEPELPRVIRSTSKTVKWLMSQVLPVFKRVVSQHDGASSEVALAFLDVIRQCTLPDDWGDSI